MLLAKAANTSVPGGDRIAADIKGFWQWDRQRIAPLVRAFIRLDYQPKLWKTPKAVVLPKPGEPCYVRT